MQDRRRREEEEGEEYPAADSSGFSRASFRFERRLTTVEAEKEMMRRDRLMGKMYGQSVKKQIGSSWFALGTCKCQACARNAPIN